MIRAAIAAALALACAAPAAAQRIAAGVEPDTVTVGEPARVAVRLELPTEYTAVFPDTLPLGADLEHTARRRVVRQPLPGGGSRVTALYRIVGWRPGDNELPSLVVELVGPADRRSVRVELPGLHVASVLPEDTAGLSPRPPADVLGRDWLLWPLALLALGLLLAAAAAFLVRRRRTAALPAADLPADTPRERALRALEAARTEGLLESGELKAFYSRVSEALRHFLAETGEGRGADLTTSELLPRLEHALTARELRRLQRVLEAADAVKFARRRPAADEAMADWTQARAWLEDVDLAGGAP